MSLVLGISFFIFGTLIGSFLNVVVLRYNTGKSLGGRSSCQSCGHQLHWDELVPIVSFLLLRGRCQVCGSAVSVQYPLVELVSGLFFLTLFIKGVVGVELLFLSVIGSLLIAIVVYDIRHGIIPDGLVYAFATLAVIRLCVIPTLHTPSPFELLSGVIVASPIFLLWFVSKGLWIGFGDAKLALGIGWFLGISGGFSALMFSFWVGAVVSIALMASIRVVGALKLKKRHKDLTMKSELPFAPFMVIGFFLVYFFNLNIITLLLS
jgi:leader peptidase (prepilin peptidase)/N-methyltransferase